MSETRNPWLIGPRADTAFFIGAPLLIVPLYHVAAWLVPLAILQFVVLSLSATGHHLPGFIRAYTDPVVFARFRARLIVVPALIVALAALAAWYKLSVVFFLLIAWGTWHGIMQVHGFTRLYDVKAGHHDARTARLDLWLCLTWFVQVVLWAADKKASLLGTFYQSGGPLLPTAWVKTVETGWLALTVAVTIAYAGLVFQDVRAGTLNLRKLASLAISLGFWAYCLIAVDNLIVGLLLWEIFHDLQYNAFVWSYNRSRVDRGLSQSRVETFLFRGGWGRTALYSLLIVGYGLLGFFTQDLIGVYEHREVHADAWRRLGNVFAASALIHFYLDGFIWKMRDAKVRADLGAVAAAPSAVTAATTAGTGAALRHWLFVAVVLGGSLALAASERLHWTASQRAGHFANLTTLVPGSAYAHFMRASELKASGDFAGARSHFGEAIALDTNYAFAEVLVADLNVRLGDTSAAIASYEAARALDPEDPLVAGNLAALYLATGRLEPARAAFEALVTLEPDNAAAHFGLADALLRLRRGLDAKPHLERSLALDAAQPQALNYLGMVEHASGNTTRARALYEAALRLAPDYASARANLAALNAPY